MAALGRSRSGSIRPIFNWPHYADPALAAYGRSLTDANDCDLLRFDPAFKAACDRLPISGAPLASQPTMSRLENGIRRRDLYRIAKALVDGFIASYDRPPIAVVLDIDDTDDEVHAKQQLSLFNGYYNERCYCPSLRDCPHRLRRITYHDKTSDKTLTFLTNHLHFGPTTIARIYKDRWHIELFFKALKQNLKIKTFVGTSANALKIRIWTALIAMLLLKYLQLRSGLNWAFSNLVALLRWNLFTYRDLWTWIDNPVDTPPQPPIPI